MDDVNAPDKLVGALINGLAIVRHLSMAKAPLSVTQISRDLQINPSTCFNILKTLLSERLITFDQTRKTYEVGIGLVSLSRGLLEGGRFIRLLKPHLEQVSTEFNVTSALWQKSGNRVVLVDRAEAESTIRIDLSIGQRLPLYLGAFGRCMAAQANLTDSMLLREFKELRWQRPPSFDEFKADVRSAAKRGYATDIDSYVTGVTTIASAINNAEGNAVMAISAIGFSGQFTDEMIEHCWEAPPSP